WLPWSASAFARASREGKPVLLSITAAWCRACHEWDRTAYADPAVAALIGDRFVPVRVDTDRRPDVNERYNLGGWPTTAFLTSEGHMLSGGTYLDPAQILALAQQVADAWRRGADEIRARAARNLISTPASIATSAQPDIAAVHSMRALIVEQFDPLNGGFGADPKAAPH